MSEKLVPFKEFIKSLQEKKIEHFKADFNFKVKDDDEFEKMNQHLIDHYEGVEAIHSFKDQSGQVWDCIPVEQQPSFKKYNSKIPRPPDLQSISTGEKESGKKITSFLNAGLKDDEGNMMNCPQGYIAMRRVTLEELTRFETLENFFKKGPNGSSFHPRFKAAEMEVDVIHKYAHAYQIVNNSGGHSYLNLWQPKLSGNEVFSLSQHWYTAGIQEQIQTVEAGWQVYPQKYDNSLLPCLFIYWTADGYNQTGCYNLDSPAFIQTNNNWALGGPLQNVSTRDGAQFDLELTWSLTEGRWWLYLNGLTADHAVGFYPVSLFNNGPLASFATEIDYGGEVVGSTSWPEMGSGSFANEGYQKAAYQRNINYYQQQDGSPVWASLTGSQQSPNCFTIDVSDNDEWGEFFFFGGPGGSNC